MANGSIVLTNALVEINAVDISSYVREVGINLSAETVDDSAMGDTYRSRLGGARSYGMSVTMNQDFVASGPHATLFSLFGTSACWEVRPVNACASSNNPIMTGVGIMTGYDVLSGQWAELVDSPITFEGSGAITFASFS